MNSRISILFMLLFWIQIGNSQSIITDLLFHEAENVMKGQVRSINEIHSNDQGQELLVRVAVDKYYKFGEIWDPETWDDGLPKKDRDYNIEFIIRMPNYVNLEHDTLVSDWTKWIDKGRTYVFFLDGWNVHYKKQGLNRTTLAVSKFQGIHFNTLIDDKLLKFQHKKVRPRKPSEYAQSYQFLLNHSDSIFLAEVTDISEIKTDQFQLKLNASGKEIILNTRSKHCLCPSGRLKEGTIYKFYTFVDVSGQSRLTDEWLGVSLASSWDKFNQWAKFQAKSKPKE